MSLSTLEVILQNAAGSEAPVDGAKAAKGSAAPIYYKLVFTKDIEEGNVEVVSDENIAICRENAERMRARCAESASICRVSAEGAGARKVQVWLMRGGKGRPWLNFGARSENLQPYARFLDGPHTKNRGYSRFLVKSSGFLGKKSHGYKVYPVKEKPWNRLSKTVRGRFYTAYFGLSWICTVITLSSFEVCACYLRSIRYIICAFYSAAIYALQQVAQGLCRNTMDASIGSFGEGTFFMSHPCESLYV